MEVKDAQDRELFKLSKLELGLLNPLFSSPSNYAARKAYSPRIKIETLNKNNNKIDNEPRIFSQIESDEMRLHFKQHTHKNTNRMIEFECFSFDLIKKNV